VGSNWRKCGPPNFIQRFRHVNEIQAIWPWVALATVGVTIGTVLGSRVLRRIPEVWFHRVLALVLAVLGGAMLIRGLGP
jgi:uncharacterized membrane protein YfcA